MIGYVYLDVNGALNYKTKEYIDKDNPGFWGGENSAFILKVWIFDTEDMESMKKIFRAFSQLKLKSTDVLRFCESINFDISILKKNENSLLPG